MMVFVVIKILILLEEWNKVSIDNMYELDFDYQIKTYRENTNKIGIYLWIYFYRNCGLFISRRMMIASNKGPSRITNSIIR
jgi:hypothetical protein